MKTYTVEECWGLLLDSFGLTHFVKEFFVIACLECSIYQQDIAVVKILIFFFKLILFL